MRVVTLHVKYLGVPITSDFLRYLECTSLFQRVLDKFNNWASSLLLMAGRAELNHTMITPMILY